MLHEIVVVGFFRCNCQILACEATGEAVIIDPGGEGEKILEIVRHYDLRVRALLHTHAHLDHIGATRAVKERVGGEIMLHEGDVWLFNHLPLQAALFGMLEPPPPAVERFIAEGDRIPFGRHAAEVLHTPGHTPGSVSFHLFAEGPLLFSGDTLFAGGIGRSDLWGGSPAQLRNSLERRILTLPEETRVFPGHGPPTTIGEARKRYFAEMLPGDHFAETRKREA
ncbi:MAG: MBL fold metallo-hydrolase [Deltaproteobacteria bacterium]|nr:MAG: MBL fold metallo-hydrolase [Deltaproteobacteria bacterium]